MWNTRCIYLFLLCFFWNILYTDCINTILFTFVQRSNILRGFWLSLCIVILLLIICNFHCVHIYRFALLLSPWWKVFNYLCPVDSSVLWIWLYRFQKLIFVAIGPRFINCCSWRIGVYFNINNGCLYHFKFWKYKNISEICILWICVIEWD